ncbi:hypothetical protein KC19_9G006200 [Ceratodon purpureus]|uniref:Uncharacterized protein n=1 Tax=Ceratodon purpureus TaxID=3225 RepID=A0A8T0GR72_CERPU|nr:hypothetical protein KC19_9G006200 [Ceratodon purpureus]
MRWCRHHHHVASCLYLLRSYTHRCLQLRDVIGFVASEVSWRTWSRRSCPTRLKSSCKSCVSLSLCLAIWGAFTLFWRLSLFSGAFRSRPEWQCCRFCELAGRSSAVAARGLDLSANANGDKKQLQVSHCCQTRTLESSQLAYDLAYHHMSCKPRFSSLTLSLSLALAPSLARSLSRMCQPLRRVQSVGCGDLG